MRERSADIFDYVIVGGGTAGCLLANRLTEDGRRSVCLLEAGPPDRNLFLHVPAGFIKVGYNPKYTWPFQTEPSEGTAGRRILTTQGRTLGGSSAINGFNYTRGQPGDYDTWAGYGNPGWGYADVLPYFKRTERRIGDADPKYRGLEGLMPVTDCDWRHPLCDAFIDGAAAMGIPKHVDYNAQFQTGTGYYQRWIENGWRVSSARAFLQPAKRRQTLEVRTNAHVTAVLMKGKRASGIEYARPDGSRCNVLARSEIILCAGAANTPKLLQLSGIGPAPLLQKIGVPVNYDLPAVGENLQDHYMVRSIVQVKGVDTLNSAARGVRLLREILRWTFKRPSILAISPSVAYAFCRADGSAGAPDLQFHFSPGSYASGIAGKLDAFPGMTLGFYQLRPASVGYVRARSANPFEDPLIQPNYLAAKEDQTIAVAALRLARRFLHTPRLQAFQEREVSPPASATSHGDLLEFARMNGGTAWHLMGTCRMGPVTQPDSVVDPELKVIGVQGLRVADASIMPTMPSGNTGAPVMMIAEKASDLILGRSPPRPEYPATPRKPMRVRVLS